MGILTDNGVDAVHHYTPLHYLPFIARSGKLLGKPALAAAGFGLSHLRSMSSQQDVQRGFGEHGFLTIDSHPRILAAKLNAGFPHIGVLVPAAIIEDQKFALCRYNVAMTRYLRRHGKPGFEESATNGRYYDGRQIPIALEAADKAAMLHKYVGSDTMIEVLMYGDLDLPVDTKVVVYSQSDVTIAEHVLGFLNVAWTVVLTDAPGEYHRRQDYAAAVSDFIGKALADPSWRGDGLEFDRV